MNTKWILAAAFWISGFGAISAQTIEAVPAHIMFDDSSAIRAKGLQPSAHVSIRGELVDGAGHAWTSEAEFVVDDAGIVDTSKQGPIKGSYKDVSAMGLVWSMTPTEKNVDASAHPHNFGSQIITFRLLQNGAPVSSTQLEQRALADGVQTIKVEGQLHGLLLEPGGAERHPGVLVVGGSEGGVPVEKALWLASHGYAALALAYFRYEDLPKNLEAIPLEYFGRAIQWMTERPEISPDRIAVVGTSRGGELALQLGAMYPELKAVVAYVPADVRFGSCCGGMANQFAWTWGGHPLGYTTSLYTENMAVKMRAAIVVEHTHGPIVLISGDEDSVWPSSIIMANAVADRLKEAHFAYDVEHLNYPHAGHRAGRPEIVPALDVTYLHLLTGRVQNAGGSTEGNVQSSLDAIPKVLAFLCKSLQSCPFTN